METAESARNLYVDHSRQAPHAFVVLKEGARADERELREFARANLAHFKAPHSVTFVKELPKTATEDSEMHFASATACDRAAAISAVEKITMGLRVASQE